MELLATNPRLISPCIDLPLASVQIERPGSLTTSGGLPGYYYHMTSPPSQHHSLPWPPQSGQHRRYSSCDCGGNNNMETKEDVLLHLVKHQSVGGCSATGYIYVCHHEI